MSGGADILDYANPTGGQPLGSLFTVEGRGDGVTLTKPLPPDPVGAVAALLVGCLSLALPVTALVKVLVEHNHARPGEASVFAVGHLCLVAIGTGCFIHASRLLRHRTQIIALVGDRLTVTNSLRTLTGRPWHGRGVTTFGVGSAQPDLLGRRMVAGVMAYRRFGFAREIVARLPRDECVWMAGLLNAALPATPTSTLDG